MKPFSYAAPSSYPEASALLREHPLALPKAGGTDLMDLLKEGVVSPPQIVALGRIERLEGNPNALFANMTLAALSDPGLAERFPALAEAASEAATPQVRNQGTVGGNLAQAPRCAYLRTRHACLRLGDSECAAAAPEAFTRFHGVFPAGGCRSGHSSSLAPALIVLGAQVVIQGPKGERSVAVEDLYRAPEAGALGDTILGYDELITRVQEVRLAAGGIATSPRRLKRAEAALRGKPLTEETLRAAGEAACAGAQPTAHNGHKLILLQRLIARALRHLAAGGKQK